MRVTARALFGLKEGDVVLVTQVWAQTKPETPLPTMAMRTATPPLSSIARGTEPVQRSDITGTVTPVRQEISLAHYRTTVSSKWDAPTAFNYMSDFSNCERWDPGVSAATQLSTGEVGLGTKFELLATFNGRTLPLTYEITTFEPPRRVVLRAETNMVQSIDEVTFSSTPEGTEVAYSAILRTRGWFRLAAPVVALMFRGIGERARVGLQRELNV